MNETIEVKMNGAEVQVASVLSRRDARGHSLQIEAFVVTEPTRFIHPGPYRRVGEARSAEDIHD